MTTNLEVYFCDICNQSVPGSDLESGQAVRVRDRVVGGCCVNLFRAPGSPSVRADSAQTAPRAGLTSLWTVIPILLAVGGATAFLEFRASEDAGITRGLLNSVEARISAHAERLDALAGSVARIEERALDPVRVSAQFEAIEARVRAAVAEAEGRDGKVRASVADAAAKLEERLVGFREEQLAARSLLQTLSADLAALRAAPTPTPSPASAEAPSTVPVEARAPAEPELPSDLKHQVASLADEDAGTRFAAVEKLLRSKDRRILGSVLPMAKDSNLFVRRLTVEGLREFRCAESVDALLVALADPEALVRFHAIQSLRAITSQRLEFDPDAPQAARTAAQRRWQEWWDKNRSSFAF